MVAIRARWARKLPVILLAMILTPAIYAQSDFIRGDVDGDGFVRLAVDAGRLAEALFGGGPPLPCEDAGDVNDNGVLELTDLALLLDQFFAPGMSIPAPFPGCGDDSNSPPDLLGCVTYNGCGAPPNVPTPDPNLLLDFRVPAGTAPGTVTVNVTLDVAAGDYAGWSFGVCHDPGLASIISINQGATLAALTPDFDAQEDFGMGWQTATLLSSTAATSLSAGLGYELYTVDYDHFGMGDSPLTFCQGFGATLPVEVLFVTSGTSEAVTPTTSTGTLAAPSGPPAGSFIRGDADGNGVIDFVADSAYLSDALFQAGPVLDCEDTGDFNDDGSLDLADLSFMFAYGFEHHPGPVPAPFPDCGLDPTSDTLTCLSYTGCGGPAPAPLPDGSVTVCFGDAEDMAGNGTRVRVMVDTTTDLAGWSFGVCHDPNAASLSGVDLGPALSGLSPDFEVRTLLPNGWAAATLIRGMGGIKLPPGNSQHIYTAKYMPTGAGNPQIQVCAGLDDPPVPVTFAGGLTATAFNPVATPGFAIPANGQYVRGDANTDGILDLSDAIFIIAWAFNDGINPTCFRAADANGDQTLDIADMIWLVIFFFQNGPAPPPPYPSCGFAASPLSCVSYPHCP